MLFVISYHVFSNCDEIIMPQGWEKILDFPTIIETSSGTVLSTIQYPIKPP